MTTPTAHPPAPPTAEVLALLPMWARAAVIVAPIMAAAAGSLGGAFTGGAAGDAVMSQRIDTVEGRLDRMESKIDRITELVLRGSP